jgi:hypothetical protein
MFPVITKSVHYIYFNWYIFSEGNNWPSQEGTATIGWRKYVEKKK